MFPITGNASSKTLDKTLPQTNQKDSNDGTK
jgi:hypothetical protein